MREDTELRPSSPITQIIDATAIELVRQCAAAEGAYYASLYQDASGEALYKQIALAGFSRIPTPPRPTPEDYAPLEPISVYGASKLGEEGLARRRFISTE